MDKRSKQNESPRNLRAVPRDTEGSAAAAGMRDTMAMPSSGVGTQSGPQARQRDTIGGPAPRPPVEVGDVVNGKYRIEGIIGEGGVGIVVSAQHLELDERVALKFLKAEALGDPGLVARFAREAKAAVSIKSEHVARILDVGMMGGSGAPFIVMEYLDGTDLGTAIQLYGVFSVSDAAEYALHVCEALAMAHANGIIHRDIKPDNLFLTANAHTPNMKSVKVLDFGISKAALTGSVFRQDIPLVQTVQLMGTPLYMSPEQVRLTSEADARSDIWSLGMVIYEMLAGTTAFNAASLTELCAAILERPIAPIREHRLDIPEGFARAVERCLMKDPADRFQNVGELASALFPYAPKRARVSAERAVGVLRACGIARNDIRLESTVPGATEEALLIGERLSASASGGFTVATAAPPSGSSLGLSATAPPPPQRTGLWLGLAAALVAIVSVVTYGVTHDNRHGEARTTTTRETLTPTVSAAPVVSAAVTPPVAQVAPSPVASGVASSPAVDPPVSSAPVAARPLPPPASPALTAPRVRATLPKAAGKSTPAPTSVPSDGEPDLGY